jgi:hypothetical protein
MATTRASHKKVNNFGSMHIVEPWDPKYIFANQKKNTKRKMMGANANHEKNMKKENHP